MDALFAKILGDSAVVQTRVCDDPVKGKGVFALLPLDAGVVALRDSPVSFVTSNELSTLALEDPKEALPVPHKTCATCCGFVGTLQVQLGALLDARNAGRAPDSKGKGKGSKGSNASDGNPPKNVEHISLPTSNTQSIVLRSVITKDKQVYCSKQCASSSEHKLKQNNKSWAKFTESLGEIPRADRRSLLLAARFLSKAIAGGPKSTECEAARLIQSDYIWTLLDRDSEAVEGVREALAQAWPDLKSALISAHGASAVKKCESIKLAGFESPSKPGLATFEGYAALCGAAQRNGMSVKIPNPLTRYVATTPEAGAAPGPMKPAVKWLLKQQDVRNAQRVEEEERAVFGNDDTDDGSDDDDSDSDDEPESGDERIEVDWGHTCQFECNELFPPARGAAVFPLASGLNHSCSPNCEIAYVEDNSVIVVVTTDVALGEELTISYVDVDGTEDERREELSEVYGFECTCPRCSAEAFGNKAKATAKSATTPVCKKTTVGKTPVAKKTIAKKTTPAAKKTPVTGKMTTTKSDQKATPKTAKKATPKSAKKTPKAAAAKKTPVAKSTTKATPKTATPKTPVAPPSKRKAAITEKESTAKKPKTAKK